MDLNFTKHEKEVLKILLENGRLSDTEIAKKLHISPQAAGKIRKKLEEEKVIEGYYVNLNFERMGINTFALLYIDASPKYLKILESKGLKELSTKVPQTLMSARLIGSDYNFFSINGFRNQVEMEDYINKLRIKGEHFLKIVRVDTFSSKSLTKDFNRSTVFMEILEGKIPTAAFELIKKVN